jgi:hypothetical protein
MKKPTFKQKMDVIKRLKMDYDHDSTDRQHTKLMLDTYKLLCKDKLYQNIKYKNPEKFFIELHKMYNNKSAYKFYRPVNVKLFTDKMKKHRSTTYGV